MTTDHHLGNHVAGTPHHHGVADAHVLAPRLRLVVQRGIGHRHAADEDRRQARHRRDRPGAADLHLDRLHRGQCLFRRILVRHRPARLARDEAEALLQRQRIHLVHHAVDVEGQRIAHLAHAGMKCDQAVGARHHGTVLADRQAEGGQRVEHAGMRRRQVPATRVAQAVGIEGQGPLGRHRRIELADAAGGAVARIDQRRPPPRALLSL
jgi:hypothetical protein